MFELTDFFEFLKRPRYTTEEGKETPVLKTAFKVFLIIIVLFTMINGLIHSFLGLFFTLPKDELEEFLSSLKIGRWGIFAVIVLVGPVMEEFIFRFPLVFRIQYISIIFAILFAVVIHYFIPYLPVFMVLLLLLVVFSYFGPKYEKEILAIWVRYFRFVVWFSAISFGLWHIGNFEIVKASHYLIVPLLVLPQLGTGFILSYVRLTYKRGFLIGLLVHMFINFVPATILLFKI